MTESFNKMLAYLKTLIGKPFIYGYKSSDLDLCDWGFGEPLLAENYKGETREVSTHILHTVCRFKVIWKVGDRHTEDYDEETTYKVFNALTKRIMGSIVRNVKLSEKNDLWLSLDNCTIVFLTTGNEKESWRFFVWGDKNPHLVASNSWMEFN